MADKPKPARVEAIVTTGAIPDGFKVPAKPARAGNPNGSKYPFDSLEVGQFFGVKNKTRRGLTSPVANANKKFRVKDASGKDVQTRSFYAVDVEKGSDTEKSLKGTAFEGSSALVIREA